MRHLYIRIYAFIAMLAIFFVVGMFIFHIIDDTNKEVEKAQITFLKFEKAIAYEVKNSLLEDEASRQRLRGLARVLNVKGFVIQIAPNAGKVFSYPSDSNLFAIVNGNVLIKEHSKFLKVFKTEGYTTLEGSQQRIFITVMVSIFPSDMLFIRSRSVFFFALGLIFLTGLIRILLSIKPSEKIEKVYTSFNEKPNPAKYSYSSYVAPSPTFDEGFTDVLGSSNEMETHTEVPKYDDFSGDVLSTPAFGTPSESTAFTDTSALSSNDIPESYSDGFSSVENENSSSINANEEPRGLYSPTTGFGWRSYLPYRLNAEIERAAASDQDMSFAIVKIRNIDFSSLNMGNISEIVLDAFLFQDMIFEYSDDITLGFAGILQDLDVEDALKICGSLFSKLKNEIYLTGQEANIGIGITTRACRLAKAELLINEAEAAVSRGLKNKDDPIVGFKPSAEKYRQQVIEERE